MDDVSLFSDDAFNMLLNRVWLGSDRMARRTGVLWCVTWLFMAVLALGGGVAIGPTPRESFLLDFAAYGQFWLGLPLLLLAEPAIDRRMRATLHEFTSTGLVPDSERARYFQVIAWAVRAKKWWLIDAALLFAAYLSTWTWRAEELSNGSASWHARLAASGETPTAAGTWVWLFAVPFFQYVVFRWIWKIALWIVLLGRVSRMRLRLVATHPDLCGGLRFLGEMQGVFGVLIFGIGCVVAATELYKLLVEHAAPDNFATFGLIASYALLAPAAFLAPLFLFSGQLYAAKEEGLARYGPVASAYARAFDAKWIESGRYHGEEFVGNTDIQSFSALSGVFSGVEHMKIVPFDLQTASRLVVTALSPMLPVIATHYPSIKALLHFVLTAGGGAGEH